MALRVRFQYSTLATLGYSVERLSDGLYLDFTDKVFRASPAITIVSLPEDVSPFLGRYRATLTPTLIAQFSNGNYVVTVHDQAAASLVIGELGVTMFAGDDQPSDFWLTSLPGSYPTGSAGRILASSNSNGSGVNFAGTF